MGELIYVDFRANRKPAVTAAELVEVALAIDDIPERQLEALKLYEQAIAIEPLNGVAWCNAGNIYVRLGDLNEASNCYAQAVRLEPNDGCGYYNLGWVHLTLGRYHQAVECLTASIKLDPKLADAHYNLALAYSKLDKPGSADVHFRRYLRLEPNGHWAEMAKRSIRFKLGSVD